VADVPAELSALLDGYLCEAGRRRWSWGDVDCFLFVADWIERITGIDCAGEYRGAYTTSREARRLIKDNGGPVAFADVLLARAGCVATKSPQQCDVALVRVRFAQATEAGRLVMSSAATTRPTRTVFGPIGAICRRPGLWAVKPADAPGLVFGDFPLIQAWALPHG